jgi:nitrate reductase gamma subunit
MHTWYPLVTGPLAWIAFSVFVLGIAGKLIFITLLARKKDPTVLSYLDWKFSLRSIFVWLLPFRARSWRMNPVLTVVTFVFHVLIFVVPIFLGAHVMLWDQFWGVSFWSLKDWMADLMTILVLVICVYFGVRRFRDPNVRFVSTFRDWLVLALVALPFMTGFLAFHQIFDYQTMVVIHILTGEILLVSIPFTRLNHMIYALPMRAYIGSEFGAVRQSRDW